jgi:hypothetical protein
MTEHAPDRIWSGIDIPKTIAGVLAAVSAAVIGSFLGVAGTLAGAAIASIIGSVGTEVYHRFIHHGRKRLEGTFLTAPAAVGTPPVAAAAQEVPSSAEPASGAAAKKLRWGRVAMVAGALFVLAMGTITMAEMFSGKSVADATRGGSGDRLTVSSIFAGDSSGNKSDKSDESPEPAPTSTVEPGSGGNEPTGGATTAPDDQPTDTPPATEAPTDGGGDSTGTGDTDSGTGTGTEPAAGADGAADTQNLDKGTE